MSSELLPEIDSYELSMFVSECYRVVTPGALTVHSFLSLDCQKPSTETNDSGGQQPAMDEDSSQRMVFSQTGPGNVGAKASGVSKHPGQEVQEQSDYKSPSSATSP